MNKKQRETLLTAKTSFDVAEGSFVYLADADV